MPSALRATNKSLCMWTCRHTLCVSKGRLVRQESSWQPPCSSNSTSYTSPAASCREECSSMQFKWRGLPDGFAITCNGGERTYGWGKTQSDSGMAAALHWNRVKTYSKWGGINVNTQDVPLCRVITSLHELVWPEEWFWHWRLPVTTETGRPWGAEFLGKEAAREKWWGDRTQELFQQLLVWTVALKHCWQICLHPVTRFHSYFGVFPVQLLENETEIRAERIKHLFKYRLTIGLGPFYAANNSCTMQLKKAWITMHNCCNFLGNISKVFPNHHILLQRIIALKF